jgi:hypothetical protein
MIVDAHQNKKATLRFPPGRQQAQIDEIIQEYSVRLAFAQAWPICCRRNRRGAEIRDRRPMRRLRQPVWRKLLIRRCRPAAGTARPGSVAPQIERY